MENCVREAIYKAEFGVGNRDTVPKLFMVNEAEAAATFTLMANTHTLKVMTSSNYYTTLLKAP